MTSPDDRYERHVQAVMRTALWLNPVTGTPSAAFETSALLDSFGPSLMPRAAAPWSAEVHRGPRAC